MQICGDGFVFSCFSSRPIDSYCCLYGALLSTPLKVFDENSTLYKKEGVGGGRTAHQSAANYSAHFWQFPILAFIVIVLVQVKFLNSVFLLDHRITGSIASIHHTWQRRFCQSSTPSVIKACTFTTLFSHQYHISFWIKSQGAGLLAHVPCMHPRPKGHIQIDWLTWCCLFNFPLISPNMNSLALKTSGAMTLIFCRLYTWFRTTTFRIFFRDPIKIVFVLCLVWRLIYVVCCVFGAFF